MAATKKAVKAKRSPAKRGKPVVGAKTSARSKKPIAKRTIKKAPSRGKSPSRKAASPRMAGRKPTGGAKLAPRRSRQTTPKKSAVLAPPTEMAEVKAASVSESSHPVATAIAKAGLDKKAEDVLILDVRGMTSYADYFVVMTADSDRQAGAIADHVEQKMKADGVSKVGVEGYQSGKWILVDYGDVIAHVMNRESREFYDIEGLWADAPRVRVG